jgi:hypothetical protein
MYLLSKDFSGTKYKILIEVAGTAGYAKIFEKLSNSRKFVQIGILYVIGAIQDPYKTNLSSLSSELLKIGNSLDDETGHPDDLYYIETSSEASEEDLTEYGLKEFSINTSPTSVERETELEKIMSLIKSLNLSQTLPEKRVE